MAMKNKNPIEESSLESPGFHLHPDPVVASEDPLANQESKFVSSSVEQDISGEALELPRSYGEDVVFLVAQDPHRLFTYWDLDISHHPGGPALLRCYRGEKEVLETEFEVPFETRNWYIPVSSSGETYRVELGFYRDGSWQLLGSSNSAWTPPSAPSSSQAFQVASLPDDHSLQSILEKLPPNLRQQPDLLRLLSGLRLTEQQLAGLNPDAESKEHPLQILQALLGRHLFFDLLGSPMDSAGLTSRIQERLGEVLAGGSSGELLDSFSRVDSSLFSGFFPAGGLSSENLSSWTESLLSWSHAARHAAASEWLSSWGLPGGESSAMSVSAASWSGAVSSSFASAGLTSWTSETLSSWQAAETGSWMVPVPPREFYMHVNAELIFYGGTHPQASLTIAGKPVQLAPDGSFRYHFAFPEGEFEIPILATSPDGVETRRAVLRFERETEKSGGVDDTQQPPLEKPMGRTK